MTFHRSFRFAALLAAVLLAACTVSGRPSPDWAAQAAAPPPDQDRGDY